MRNELYHYGVLGMKWGMRRARKKGTVYTYRSHGTKKYDRKVSRLEKKLNSGKLSDRKAAKLNAKKLKYEYRANRSRELDRREQEYAKRVKVGGNLVSRYLSGGHIGGKPYQQYVAMQNAQSGFKEGKNVVRMGAAAVASALGGRIGSTAVKAYYIRQGEDDYIDEHLK